MECENQKALCIASKICGGGSNYDAGGRRGEFVKEIDGSSE